MSDDIFYTLSAVVTKKHLFSVTFNIVQNNIIECY